MARLNYSELRLGKVKMYGTNKMRGNLGKAQHKDQNAAILGWGGIRERGGERKGRSIKDANVSHLTPRQVGDLPRKLGNPATNKKMTERRGRKGGPKTAHARIGEATAAPKEGGGGEEWPRASHGYGESKM